MAGIYIHIPFCASKCRYCDFFSRVINNPETRQNYVNALCKEIELQKDFFGSREINSIYFGGGTPSLLKISQLQQIFNTINRFYTVSNDSEITLEANPEDLSLNFLQELKTETLVNRLSVGLQSFSDDDLLFMNRRHKAIDSIKAIENAQSVGFLNITGDLIFGLPKQTIEKWENNLDLFFKLGIPHLSAYSLTIEQGTVFGLWQQKGKIAEINDELSLKMYEKLIDKAESNGFIHYEISNFAKEGFLAKHNFSYWIGEKYLGIGASAHSFNQKERFWNIDNVEKYSESVFNNKIPAEKEVLSEIDLFNEKILTGLRTYSGVCISELKKLNQKYYSRIETVVLEFINDELLIEKNDHLILTKKGKFVSDMIMSELIIV